MTKTNINNNKFLAFAELNLRLSKWKKELSLNKEKSAPQFERPALLVLDMQNEFLTDEGQMPVWGGPSIIPNIQNLLKIFRKNQLPIFFTRHLCIEPYRHQETFTVMEHISNPAAFLADGSYGAKLHSEIKPLPHEYIISKYRYSAFYDTPLDTFLRVNKITDVVITGVATNICCEATSHDAFFRGYNVFLP